MDYYAGRFGQMDDARKAYSRLKAKYNGEHTEIKLVRKTVIVPESAKSTLEQLAKRLHAACKISKIKKERKLSPDR